MFRSLVTLLGVAALATVSLSAQSGRSTNKGSTPNGKPFVQIQGQISDLQGQIDAVYQKIAALDARVTSIESNLQANLTAIYARVTDLETRATSLDASVATLQNATDLLNGRVGANEAAIGALQTANSALTAQLEAVRTELTTADGVLRDELRRVGDSLNTLIEAYTYNIQNLQNEAESLRRFLDGIAGKECAAGEAVRAISPTGILVCTSVTGGNLNATYHEGYFELPPASSPLVLGFAEASFSCPAGWVLGSTGVGYSQAVTIDSFTDHVSYASLTWDPFWGTINGITNTVYSHDSYSVASYAVQVASEPRSTTTFRVRALNRHQDIYMWVPMRWSAVCMRLQ